MRYIDTPISNAIIREVTPEHRRALLDDVVRDMRLTWRCDIDDVSVRSAITVILPPWSLRRDLGVDERTRHARADNLWLVAITDDPFVYVKERTDDGHLFALAQ